MSEVLHQLLATSTETEVLEFKKAERQFDKDKLGRYFSALSNEANLAHAHCAWLLFGVNDRKEIVGTHISDSQLNEYKIEVANHTSPTLSFTRVERVNTPQGNVILFEIPPAPQGMPIAWKDHYYARNGESLGGLSINKIEKIRNQKIKYDWSSTIISEASIHDLDEQALLKAREQFAEKNPKLAEEIPHWDDEKFLKKAKITIDGKITYATILLLGKPESVHYLNTAGSTITWILKDRDNLERDYEHFSIPLILSANEVYGKIRNLKYRYMQEGSLFPEEVNMYDPYIIREALNNCIAHQDYTLSGKVTVVEREDGYLTFLNSGTFIPENIEKVIEKDVPENEYRNPFLAQAMVSLNMIDTIGGGIKKMFVIQKNKYFPLPDYDLTNNKVKVQITGKVVDLGYARKLIQVKSLNLQTIILLDKVAKGKPLTDIEIKELKALNLIEGRKPNFYISSSVARVINEKGDYIKLRGFKDAHYKDMILAFIKKYGSASKADIDTLLLDTLPSVLDEKQKENKIRNIVYAMSKRDLSIENTGTTRKPKWVLSLSN